MEDQLISFETAKLAKEKGFNEPTHGRGWVNNYYNHLGVLKGDVTELVKAQVHKKDTKPFETIAAPTQSLLQKWLREKHNLMCFVDFPNDWSYFTGTVIRKGSSDMVVREIEQDTYEEALEVALLESLKLIT